MCTKWMRKDEKTKKLFVMYPPPPYTEDASTLYNDYLENRFDAPHDWKDYHIDILGRSCEYLTH